MSKRRRFRDWLKDVFDDFTAPISRSDYNFDTSAPPTSASRMGESRRLRKQRKRMAKASREARNEDE